MECLESDESRGAIDTTTLPIPAGNLDFQVRDFGVITPGLKNRVFWPRGSPAAVTALLSRRDGAVVPPSR